MTPWSGSHPCSVHLNTCLACVSIVFFSLNYASTSGHEESCVILLQRVTAETAGLHPTNQPGKDVKQGLIATTCAQSNECIGKLRMRVFQQQSSPALPVGTAISFVVSLLLSLQLFWMFYRQEKILHCQPIRLTRSIWNWEGGSRWRIQFQLWWKIMAMASSYQNTKNANERNSKVQ